MKLSIIYYSKTGRTKTMAEEIAKGMKVLDRIEVGLFPVDEIDYDYIRESKAVLFGTPTYYANTCWQIKKWFDESRDCNLGGKVGGAFSTADFPQGGADTAILTIINHLMVKGMLVYSGGSALGLPYIHLGPIAFRDNFEERRELFRLFGKRIAEKCLELFPQTEIAPTEISDTFTKEELSEALRAITSTIGKCEKVQPKLKPGTAQHTLLVRRIKAFEIASALIKKEPGL